MEWVRNPNTGNADSMLSLALWGFVFSIGISTCSLIYLMLNDKDLSGLSNVSVLVGTILAPTLGSYTARKWTDIKYGNGYSIEDQVPVETVIPETEILTPVPSTEEGNEGA
jgi:hypothetical protein